MDINFVNLTAENLADEHLSCIIRSKKSLIRVLKRSVCGFPTGWKEGHVFRKLNEGPRFLLNTRLLKQPGFP